MGIRIEKKGRHDELRHLDLAFVIDTTGSMGSEIAAVRSRLRELADAIYNHSLRPTARFAVIGYRDHPPQDSSYVSKVFCGLEPDIAQVRSALDRVSADGGGDGPEAVVDGLEDARQLQWNRNAQKAVLLVGDAPPHGEGASGDGFNKGCPCGRTLSQMSRQYSKLGIIGHAVGVRNDSTMIRTFTRFANETKGEFVHLRNVDELISTLVARIGEEIAKIATDIRTIERAERGERLSAEDRESIERLEKKGVRLVTDSIATDSIPVLGGVTHEQPLRIRIVPKS